MGEKRGMQALEFWCKRVTAGYPGVCVQNMTSSWRDGLAFCALIHHFRPDLIDFEKLSKENVYKNNALAFSVAEQHLGIPALLDPEDMVEYAVPDRLSILTYLSQFYQVFGNQQTPTKVGSSATPVSLKRTTTTSEDLPPTPTKVFAREVSSVSSRRLEPCLVCKLPVFLAERLLVNNKLHHRTCFRCARCRHQLNLANYYETEQGAFCCETCPDEEPAKPIPSQSEGDESILRVETEANKVLSLNDGEEEEGKEEKERKEAARQSVQNLIARFQTEKVAMVNPLPRPSVRSAFLQEMTNVENVNTDDTESNSVVAAPTLEEKPSVAEEETPLPPEAPFIQESDEKEVKNEETKHLEAGSEHTATQIETSDALDDQEAPNPFEDDLEESDEGEPGIKPPSSCPEAGSNGELAPKEEIHEDILSDDAVTLREAGDEHRIVKNEIDTSVEVSVSAETEEGHISLTETVNKEEQVGELDTSSVNPVPKPPRRSKFLNLTDLPVAEATPIPSPRHSRVKPITEQQVPPLPTPESSSVVEQYPDDLNPFEDDEVEESQVASKKKLVPLPSTMSIPSPSDFQNTRPFESGRKVIPAPSISLNPFGSDAEEDEDDNETIFSSPKPPQRPPPPTILAQGSATVKPEALPTPSPKRAAPKPPLNDAGKGKSPVGTLRLKKDRPAPPPPVLLAKTEKEMNNMSLQSKSAVNEVISPPSKDTFGQWKRKKGPAPPRPLPQKRQLRKLPLKEVQQELQDIEVKQQELERQGVALEKSIRNLTETEIEGGGLTLEAEDMILQLFDLVNEKNDLLRRQAELMYLRRQQRLEEEHVELEFQIRCLMEKPASERTEQDLVREDELIQRLVTVVQKRSEIVDCLEMDRKREVEEDHSIQHHMDLYVAKNTQPPTPSSSVKSPSLKTKTLKLKSPAKLFKKDKKKKKDDSNLKAKPEDADKDVDDSVPVGGVAVEVKEKKDSKDFKKVKWLPRKV